MLGTVTMQDQISADYRCLLPSSTAIFAFTGVDVDLVRDFFFLFARAEYALKAAGFVLRGRNGEPKIQWSQFAEGLGDAFLYAGDTRIGRAREYLTQNPPKKQVVEGERLEWLPRTRRDSQSPAQFLLESATQVRHNLFHGGKDLRGLLVGRDRELIEAAMLTIAHAMSYNSRVMEAYLDIGPTQ